MKNNRLAFIACLTLIIAGVFFAATHAEARVFVSPGSTGCTAPAGGASIGNCGAVQPHTAVAKSWHRHWHHHHRFVRFHHFRIHHFSHRGHRGHSGHHSRHGHHGRHH